MISLSSLPNQASSHNFRTSSIKFIAMKLVNSTGCKDKEGFQEVLLHLKVKDFHSAMIVALCI
jgi:hypothetical protein